MTSPCRKFDQLLDRSRDGKEDPSWREHLDGCPTCSEQAEIDGLLKQALTNPPSIPVPTDLQVFSAAPARLSVRPSTFAARITLGLYTFVAFIASIFILNSVEWPVDLPQSKVVLVTIIVVMSSPLLVLGRSGRRFRHPLFF